MTKRLYIETVGCQMNVLDSELVENQLRLLGYDFTPSLEAADVVLYNTCSVRDRSEQKVWSRIGALKERKIADPSLVIGVIVYLTVREPPRGRLDAIVDEIKQSVGLLRRHL